MQKVAIIHDNLMAFGGAEVVLETLIHLYPQADIYTITYDPNAFRNSTIGQQHIIPSHLNKWWGSKKIYKLLFPLYPSTVEGLDLQKYDLVISSSYNVAHGVVVNPHAQHVCYMHTPSRWLWSAYHEYTDTPAVFRSRLIRFIMKAAFHSMRLWDWQAAQRPSVLIANSIEVQRRIKKYYGREARVIHPPVSTTDFQPSEQIQKGNYYLTLGRMVPYKRVDLVVRAFRQMPQKQLVVAGAGPELNYLQRLASGAPNISFCGAVDAQTKIELMQRAKAFIFAPFEDFGITPVEALAAGTHVVAYAQGGALEYVVPGQTGVLFNEQTVPSLVQAVNELDKHTFPRAVLQHAAQRFSQEMFIKKWESLLTGLVEHGAHNI